MNEKNAPVMFLDLDEHAEEAADALKAMERIENGYADERGPMPAVPTSPFNSFSG